MSDEKSSSAGNPIPDDLDRQVKSELEGQVNVKEYLTEVDSDYCVLLDRPEHLDLKIGTEILGKIMRLHPLDAKRLVRKGRGRFLEKLRRKEAEAIVAALGRRNITAYALSDYELIRFPKKQRCVFARCADDGLHIIHHLTLKGESFKWEDVFFMNVALVPSEYFPRFIDSEDFANAPIIQKVEDEELRAYYKEKLGQKAMSRQLTMRKNANLRARQQKADPKQSDEQTLKTEAHEDFQRKLEKATECFIDFIVLNPTRYYRIMRSDMRLDFLPSLQRGQERETNVRYLDDYNSAPDYFNHVAWLMFEYTPHLPITHSTRNFLFFLPWREAIFNAKEYYNELYELFGRLISRSGDIFHRIVGTPDMQDIYRRRALPEEVLTNIEWHFKDEEPKFEKLQRILEMFMLNAPLFPTLYRDEPDFALFRQRTEEFLMKTTLREIFESRMDEFREYQDLAERFVKQISFDNLLYDSVDEYDTLNQWYIQLKFEEFKRKALAEHAPPE